MVTSEVVRLRDLFGITRLKQGKYTPGQIDNKWSEEIEKDFSKWIRDHIDELPVPKDQIQELIKKECGKSLTIKFKKMKHNEKRRSVLRNIGMGMAAFSVSLL